MGKGARLSVTDLRQTVRSPVDLRLLVDHRGYGAMHVHLCNLSPQGFMIDDAKRIARGDRMVLTLPMIGEIEAWCMWTTDSRAGFRFERLLRPDEFDALIAVLQPNPALRPAGRG